jgi:integrase
MPRARKNPADRWLPERVYRGRRNYEWRPASGGCVQLCALSCSKAAVWQAFEDAQVSGGPSRTLTTLVELYFVSRYFQDLRASTQRGYRESWRAIEPVLGHVKTSELRSGDIRSYMDLRGRRAPVSANREYAFLSIVCRYGVEKNWLPFNPCSNVRKFRERGRQDIYISDEEYLSYLRDSDLTVQIFMEFAYLLAARTQDIRAIKLSDISEDGILIVQQKTGKRQLKRWNPRLRNVVEAALRRRDQITIAVGDYSDHLLLTRDGSAYSSQGWSSLWKRNRTRVIEKRKSRGESVASLQINWTFHDIKAKSISDYEGDRQLFSGHKSHAMMQRYNRTVDVVDSNNKQVDEVVFNF